MRRDRKKIFEQDGQGFTVLEVLVVIAIIGLLSSVILVSAGKIRIAGRDAKRIGDITQLQKGLELYLASHDSLPNCYDAGYVGGCDFSVVNAFGATITADSTLDGKFLEFLKPTYLITTPLDPINQNPASTTADQNTFLYYYTTGQFPPDSGNFYQYIIGAHLEDASNQILKTGLKFPGYMYPWWYVVGSIKTASSTGP